MLEIDVHSPDGTEKSTLALKPDTTIQMEMKSPFFDDEDEVGQYSYPLDIPGSENNRKALGSPERLESVTGERPAYWTVDVKENSIPFLTGCKMTLLKHSGNFDYTKSSYATSIAGPESLFGTLIKGKTLKDLQLGGTITFNEPSRSFAQGLMTGQYPQYNYITFVPVWCYGFIPDSMSSSLITGDMINNIVLHPNHALGWAFGSPHGYSTPTILPANSAPGDPLYRRHRTVPFFNLHYVIRKIYEEHGYTVYGDFLDDADYRKIFMFNNFGIEIYGATNYDSNRAIYPYLHMPPMPLSEFLSKVQNLFGYKAVFRDDKKVQLVYKNDLLTKSKVVDLSGRAFDFYEAELPADQDNGYTFSFAFPEQDQLAKDYAKTEIDKSKIILTVGKASQIPTGYYNNKNYKQDDLIYCEWENYYYRYNNGGWQQYSEGFEPFVSNSGKTKFEYEISPLLRHCRPEFYAGANLTEYMGLTQKGGYYNDNNAIVEEAFDLRLFYADKYSGNSGISYPQFNVTNKPYAFTHSLNIYDGTRLVKNSLNWSGQDGLYHTHHKKWTEARFNNTEIKLRFSLLPEEHDLLDFESKIKIGGAHYLVDLKSLTIGGKSIVEGTLLKV